MMLERQLTRRRPAASLRPLVHEYWFIADLAASYDGGPITTTPHTSAIVSFNIGRPSDTDFRVGAPRASLLGIQSQTRFYRPRGSTFLVMALLTIPGLATLFPCTGPMSRDNMIELGGLVGDAGTRHVLCDIEAAWSPDRIAETLDAWFLQRLMRSRASTLDFRYSHAWHSLVASGRVDVAAAASGVSTRQLERWFTRHIGQAPKTLVNIERLHASVRAVQMGGLDPIDGYSDQAHQIRSWRRYIGMTPGRYKMQQRSMMVQAFADGALTHFL